MSIPIVAPAALAYGLADFAGGLAARRASTLVVIAVANLTGLAALLPAMWLLPGRPSAAALGLGALAAVAGAAGLLLYLRGLAVGPMGVVAPLSAVVGAGLPVLVGVLSGERPGAMAILAFAMGGAAILLATTGSGSGAAAGTGATLGLGAGVGFGLFFVGLAVTPADSGLWPLLAGRLTSTTVLGAIVLARRPKATRQPGLMVVSGVSDTLANVLFLLATRLGTLGISAVVVSLYPVVVVLLARVVLRERLTRLQVTSTGLALGASVLLAANS